MGLVGKDTSVERDIFWIRMNKDRLERRHDMRGVNPIWGFVEKGGKVHSRRKIRSLLKGSGGFRN